jgi:hypothetical protein
MDRMRSIQQPARERGFAYIASWPRHDRSHALLTRLEAGRTQEARHVATF